MNNNYKFVCKKRHTTILEFENDPPIFVCCREKGCDEIASIVVHSFSDVKISDHEFSMKIRPQVGATHIGFDVAIGRDKVVFSQHDTPLERIMTIKAGEKFKPGDTVFIHDGMAYQSKHGGFTEFEEVKPLQLAPGLRNVVRDEDGNITSCDITEVSIVE